MKNILIIIIIVISKIEFAVQGRERVRTLDQSGDPNPTQPTNGRKRENCNRQKERVLSQIINAMNIISNKDYLTGILLRTSTQGPNKNINWFGGTDRLTAIYSYK